MRTLGLIGGLSWESTAVYYRLINEGVRERLGGLHSAPLALYSFDMAEIAPLQAKGDWEQATRLMVNAAQCLKAAGAEAIVICTNTMHLMADAIEEEVKLPLLHIIDSTAEALQRRGMHKAGLLGTRFTMEMPFYRERMQERFGIELLTPLEDARPEINRIIFEELCRGIIREDSRATYMQAIDELQRQGAEGIILGCTEIGLLIGQNHTPAPLFDSTLLHAGKAVEWCLS